MRLVTVNQLYFFSEIWFFLFCAILFTWTGHESLCNAIMVSKLHVEYFMGYFNTIIAVFVVLYDTADLCFVPSHKSRVKAVSWLGNEHREERVKRLKLWQTLQFLFCLCDFLPSDWFAWHRNVKSISSICHDLAQLSADLNKCNSVQASAINHVKTKLIPVNCVK